MPISMLRSVPLSKRLMNKKVGKDIWKNISGNHVLLLRSNSLLNEKKIERLLKFEVLKVDVWLNDYEYNLLISDEKYK